MKEVLHQELLSAEPVAEIYADGVRDDVPGLVAFCWERRPVVFDGTLRMPGSTIVISGRKMMFLSWPGEAPAIHITSAPTGAIDVIICYCHIHFGEAWREHVRPCLLPGHTL